MPMFGVLRITEENYDANNKRSLHLGGKCSFTGPRYKHSGFLFYRDENLGYVILFSTIFIYYPGNLIFHAMFTNFLMKQMLKRQMKGVPEAEQERIFAMIEANPDFFGKIAAETQEKIKGGMSQHDATMAVMQKHQEELKKMLGK